MRIIQIIQRPQLRGAEIFATQLARHHQSAGHAVRIISLFDAHSSQKLTLDGLDHIAIGADELRRNTDLAGWRELARQIRRYRPDIVQANAGDTWKYAVLSRLLFKWEGRLIFRNANLMSRFVDRTAKKLMLAFLARQTDFVISVSRNCEEDFVRLFPSTAGRTATIPIGTVIVNQLVAPPDFDLRQAFGIPPAEPLIVNIGSLVDEKNQTGLIDIFERLFARLGSGHLVLIGDGPNREKVEQRIRTKNLTGRVHLLGYRQDAPELLAQCNLLLLPSFIEGMPGVILEAMSRRVPVVASAIGGIPEIIIPDKTGFLADPTNPDSFLQPVLNLLMKPDLRVQIVDNAYRLCLEAFSITAISNRFLDQYDQLHHSLTQHSGI